MTPSLASSYGSCCISRLGKRLKLQFTHRGSGKTMEKMLEIEKKRWGTWEKTHGNSMVNHFSGNFLNFHKSPNLMCLNLECHVQCRTERIRLKMEHAPQIPPFDGQLNSWGDDPSLVE